MYSKYRFSKPGDIQKNIYKGVVGIIWEREIRSTYTNISFLKTFTFPTNFQMKTRNLLKRKKFHLLLVIFIYLFIKTQQKIFKIFIDYL